MKIERESLLKVLDTAVVGTTSREILEQSNSFVFTKEDLVTFNGEILTQVGNPLPGITGVIPAEDFRKVLHKFPDEFVEVSRKGEEIRIKGKNKEAGIIRAKEVTLPFKDVPRPKEWKELTPMLMGTLLQAARVCGKDDSQPMTTKVHSTKKLVEACDNSHLFRCEMETGVREELLIPGDSILAVGSITFHKMSVSKDWLHLQTKGKHRISIRCSRGDYPDLTPLLKLKNPRKVKLPGSLPDILSRAESMQDASYDATVAITIEEGKLTIRTKKESGWYRESKSIEYVGDQIRFDVNPQLLEEILAKKKSVRIGENRMMIQSPGTTFVVSLQIAEEKE